jgi:hypothetical protein
MNLIISLVLTRRMITYQQAAKSKLKSRAEPKSAVKASAKYDAYGFNDVKAVEVSGKQMIRLNWEPTIYTYRFAAEDLGGAAVLSRRSFTLEWEYILAVLIILSMHVSLEKFGFGQGVGAQNSQKRCNSIGLVGW